MNALLIESVRHFSIIKKNILVIGDVMLDRYLIGHVNRISPEAPVPVVLLKETKYRAGGAANVAANLSALGLNTNIIGFIGDDVEGATLKKIISQSGVNNNFLTTSKQRPTISKTRIMSGIQQIARIDDESSKEYSESENKSLIKSVEKALGQDISMVVLSDYGKGLLSDKSCKLIIHHCNQLGIPVIVDPKGSDYSKYKGVHALTPNKKETAEATGVGINETFHLLLAAKKVKEQLNLDFIAITRGEEGISYIDNLDTKHIPAIAKKVFDVSGAGDTVIATLAAGLVHGLMPYEALELANIAASIVVGKVGTVPVSQAELLKALVNNVDHSEIDKICDKAQLFALAKKWKDDNLKIVFTNGCFDLLHAGHVTYLEAAKKAGDRLILGLNTDRSIRALKGPSRPVIREGDRARVMAALASVDAIILFDENTPLELISSIKPDFIVKGDDYTEDQVVGGTEAKTWGGRVKLIPLLQGRSTSNIIKNLEG